MNNIRSYISSFFYIALTGCALVAPLAPHPEVSSETRQMLIMGQLEAGYARTYICGEYRYVPAKVIFNKPSDSQFPTFLPKLTDLSWIRSTTLGPFNIYLNNRILITINSDEAAVIDSKYPGYLNYIYKKPDVGIDLAARITLNSQTKTTSYISIYILQEFDGQFYTTRLIATPSSKADCANKKVVFYNKLHNPPLETPKPTFKTNSNDAEGKLETLSELFGKGLITKEDYEAKKQTILKGM